MLSNEKIKSVFQTMVNRRRLGMGPRTALSLDTEFDPAENVNVLTSTVVGLYRATLHLLGVEL